MNGELVKEVKMQKLEAERLELIPLQIHNLELALENYEQLQVNMGLRVSDTILDQEMENAMRIRLKKVLEDPENYLWLTNWAIVLKKENQIIGYIMIKGCPNENGEVIVGYGIDEIYRHNGYATEAVKGLIKWIFKNPKALSVIADTEKDNIPSHKVLQNAGALKYKESDELIWWKISKKIFD
jgi:[ribosomal protein S5]-alanine N-acetyltransferase